MTRRLVWTGGSAPRVSAVPIYSPSDQPLYGLGSLKNLLPVYVRNATDLNNTCFMPSSNPYASDYCLAATRNNPTDDSSPAFVVWPVNAT